MTKLTEQISVCLHKIDMASSQEERTINTTTLRNLLPYLLTEHEKLERENEKEIVICAAIRLPDGRVFIGHRHHNAIRAAQEYIDYRHRNGLEEKTYMEMKVDSKESNQGFVTSRNRFVDRQEGLKLQLAAGIKSADPHGYRWQLFSEDLY